MPKRFRHILHLLPSSASGSKGSVWFRSTNAMRLFSRVNRRCSSLLQRSFSLPPNRYLLCDIPIRQSICSFLFSNARSRPLSIKRLRIRSLTNGPRECQTLFGQIRCWQDVLHLWRHFVVVVVRLPDMPCQVVPSRAERLVWLTVIYAMSLPADILKEIPFFLLPVWRLLSMGVCCLWRHFRRIVCFLNSRKSSRYVSRGTRAVKQYVVAVRHQLAGPPPPHFSVLGFLLTVDYSPY
jgi:hypothetical protein